MIRFWCPQKGPVDISATDEAVVRIFCQGSCVLVPCGWRFETCRTKMSQPFAAQGLSRVSMWPILLTPLTAALRTLNVSNVRSSSRDLALEALCDMRVASLAARFPCRFFRANAFRLSLSSRCCLPRFLPWFFRRVGCSILNTPRLLHRQQFSLLACALRAFLLSSLRVPRILWQRRTSFGHGCRGKQFRFVVVHYRQSSCWQACSVRVDEISHHSA